MPRRPPCRPWPALRAAVLQRRLDVALDDAPVRTRAASAANVDAQPPWPACAPAARRRCARDRSPPALVGGAPARRAFRSPSRGGGDARGDAGELLATPRLGAAVRPHRLRETRPLGRPVPAEAPSRRAAPWRRRPAFGAAAAPALSPSASSVAIGVLTFTPSVPSATSSLPTLPSSTASTSMVALSVSISAMMSPALMVWPSLTSHLASLPSSMVGDSAGIRISVGISVSS